MKTSFGTEHFFDSHLDFYSPKMMSVSDFWIHRWFPEWEAHIIKDDIIPFRINGEVEESTCFSSYFLLSYVMVSHILNYRLNTSVSEVTT